MKEEISNGTAITLAAAVAIGILAIPALLLDAAQGNEAHKIEREIKAEIKAGNCPVIVATACGDEVCKYTARVPCAEMEALVKRGQK